MKANRQITAIITVLFIGFSTLNGQASARTENKGNQARPTVKRTVANQTQTRELKPNNTNVRQTQAYQAQTRELKPNNTNVRQSTVQAKNRPVSISTPHNPNSDYGGHYTKTPVKENKFSKKSYYSGNYYHNFYPANKVKTNYHHDAYMHHYNVLYYPAYHEIYWTQNMYRDYNRWYPNYHWNYNYGRRIYTISIFDAKYNMGEVAMVYGRVSATWYNSETDDYLLFFGGDYPAQQFTVILPGHIARKFNWRPERYFLGEHMTITGLITTFEGNPEIIVKNRQQFGIY